MLSWTAGFCFGVKRAVATVYEEIKNGKDKQEIIYTYGPIIHNEQVVSDLENKGVRVIHGKEDLKSITEGTVIIRSHGVDRETYDMIRSQGLKLVDATCPFVKKIHRTVEEKSREGYDIIIIGNEDHPEVQGIKGWSESDTYIMNTEEEAEKFSIFPGKKLCVVAQTTFNYKKFIHLFKQAHLSCLCLTLDIDLISGQLCSQSCVLAFLTDGKG